MKSSAWGWFHCSIFSGHVSWGFLFVAFLAGEQDCCFSQTHLFLLLIHNLEPQSPVISLSLWKIITVGGQYNGLFTGIFLDIKSTIWGLVPEKRQIILYEFNIIMSKLGLIPISLGSTFTHSSWSWLVFLECEVFCDFFTAEVIWREKFCNFSGLFFCFLFGSFSYFSKHIPKKKKKQPCKIFLQREQHFVFS